VTKEGTPFDFAQGKPMTRTPARRLAPVLWLIFGLFFLRVVGQVLVTFAGVTWLPSMRHWYSGLISYPYLLTSQIVMLAGMLKVNADFTRGDGWFSRPNRTFGRIAVPFGWLYLSSMILRYAITRTLLIPVTLHCVLAIYLILFGRYHRHTLYAASARSSRTRLKPRTT
jgi:hypothetical protein